MNTGACSAFAPPVGGRIKTQKKQYYKKITLTFIKDNPQYTPLHTKRNDPNAASV